MTICLPQVQTVCLRLVCYNTSVNGWARTTRCAASLCDRPRFITLTQPLSLVSQAGVSEVLLSAPNCLPRLRFQGQRQSPAREAQTQCRWNLVSIFSVRVRIWPWDLGLCLSFLFFFLDTFCSGLCLNYFKFPTQLWNKTNIGCCWSWCFAFNLPFMLAHLIQISYYIVHLLLIVCQECDVKERKRYMQG